MRSPGGTLVFPTSDGAVNFPAQSYSPDTGLFYTNATDAGSIFYLSPDPSDPTGLGRGQEWHGGHFDSRLIAIDYRTGDIKWSHRYLQQGWSSSQQPGVLSTGGGLVFLGGLSWFSESLGEAVTLFNPDLWSGWLPALIASCSVY